MSGSVDRLFDDPQTVSEMRKFGIEQARLYAQKHAPTIAEAARWVRALRRREDPAHLSTEFLGACAHLNDLSEPSVEKDATGCLMCWMPKCETCGCCHNCDDEDLRPDWAACPHRIVDGVPQGADL